MMEVDQKKLEIFIDALLELVDSKIILDNESWILEQSATGEVETLYSWLFAQLDKASQATLVKYQLDSIDAKKLSQLNMDLLEASYKTGKNKIFAWRAIKHCRENNKTFPEWVNQYLAEVADQLLAIDKPGKTAEQLVFHAVGIMGKEFTQRHDKFREWNICQTIEELKLNGRTVTEARRKYAKDTGANFNTIKEVHKEKKKEAGYPFILALPPEG